jgi:hypothetical protein
MPGCTECDEHIREVAELADLAAFWAYQAKWLRWNDVILKRALELLESDSSRPMVKKLRDLGAK